MHTCLLCLEGNLENADFIEINSDEWIERNLPYLIEKHLWPMEIKNNSWICRRCGEDLYNFHKFYKRIEEAHKSFDIVFKIEEEMPLLEEQVFNDTDSVGPSEEDCKDNVFDKITLEENVPMEPPVANEFMLYDTFIKTEKVEDIDTEDVIFSKRRKRGRPAKRSLTTGDGDPLMKTIKQSRKAMCKRNKTEEEAQKDDCPIDNDEQNSTGFNNDSDTDPENEKQSAVPKKKNHRNLDEKTLKKYDRIIAENFKIFCDICQMACDNFILLRKHFKLEHKIRGYARCCKRNFYTRSVLVDHIYVHLNPEHFKCQQCGKVFSDRSRLQSHKKLHDDNSKLDKCEKCGKLFADKGAFKKHILTHSTEKAFPCKICGKFFTNSFILNHHIEAVHQNKFVQICDICGKSIRCPTAFASHMEKHDVTAIPISCDVCGLLLSNKEGLKRHKNSQHPEGGKKEHACHICLKVSPTERALKSHIRSVHEQGFDFKCSLCEKSFKRPTVLKEHMATHTGTALYSCLWCPRTFISNGNMYNHRKNAHPKEWEELKRQRYAQSKS